MGNNLWDLVINIAQAVIAIIFTIGGWFILRLVGDSDKTKKEVDELKSVIAAKAASLSNDFSDFKLYAAREYESKTTVQMSLARIHERIDETNTRIEEGFESLRCDIKEILRTCAGRKC